MNTQFSIFIRLATEKYSKKAAYRKSLYREASLPAAQIIQTEIFLLISEIFCQNRYTMIDCK